MTTIQVFLNDGTVITASTESYNVDALTERLNDPKVLMVTVGNVIVNKNAVKLISPQQQ